jgi:hypothetical protein
LESFKELFLFKPTPMLVLLEAEKWKNWLLIANESCLDLRKDAGPVAKPQEQPIKGVVPVLKPQEGILS